MAEPERMNTNLTRKTSALNVVRAPCARPYKMHWQHSRDVVFGTSNRSDLREELLSGLLYHVISRRVHSALHEPNPPIGRLAPPTTGKLS